MFLSSKHDRTTYAPDPRRPFSRLALLAQQLCCSGPSLGRAVQAASVRISFYLSRYGPGGEVRPGKFNFGVGMGGEMNLVAMEVWSQFVCCLGQRQSLHQNRN